MKTFDQLGPPPPPGFVQTQQPYPYPTQSQPPYPTQSYPPYPNQQTYPNQYPPNYSNPTVINVVPTTQSRHQVLVVGGCPSCRVSQFREK